MSLLGKDIIVVDSTDDSDEGKMEDIFSILYSFIPMPQASTENEGQRIALNVHNVL